MSRSLKFIILHALPRQFAIGISHAAYANYKFAKTSYSIANANEREACRKFAKKHYFWSNKLHKTQAPLKMRRKILDQHGLNFLTLTVVEWIDIFTRKELKKIVLDSLRHCQTEKDLGIVAYVIMSNHIHIIAYAKRDDIPLSDILRDFKKYTSKAIVKWIKTSGKESRKEWLLRRFAYNAKLSGGRAYQVWQSPNYPTLLHTPKVIYAKTAVTQCSKTKTVKTVVTDHKVAVYVN